MFLLNSAAFTNLYKTMGKGQTQKLRHSQKGYYLEIITALIIFIVHAICTAT